LGNAEAPGALWCCELEVPLQPESSSVILDTMVREVATKMIVFKTERLFCFKNTQKPFK
jgi:hypothetical protein